MSTQTLLTIVLGIGVLLFISVRQMSWQKPGRQLKMPLVLAVVGVIEAASTWNQALLSKLSMVDFVLVGVEVVLALLGGWLMGRMTQIATINGVTQTRLRPAGLAVWLGFIALRIGMAIIGGMLGAALASNAAVILFVVAIVKGTQMLIVWDRANRHELAEADNRINAMMGS